MSPSRFWSAALAGSLLATALTGSAGAQTDQDRRLDRLDREVRELRAIVFQGKDTGQPVVVKPAGPDPAVEALSARADQFDQTIRSLSGRVELVGHELEEARRQIAADHDGETELRGELKALNDQIAKLTAPPPEPTPPTAGTPGVAAPGGQFGPADAAAAEALSFKAAKTKVVEGDFAGGADALTAYVQTYPTGPHAREAVYLLGESYYARSLYQDATAAYAKALRDWPKTAWAPDATVKLARALNATSRPEQACAALGEFQRRYAAASPKAVRAKAASTSVAAKCAG
jgi:tol-pal system protein YbgF